MKTTGGLLELPKDERDYPLGAIIQYPKLDELPESFVIGLPQVKNQGETDFCAAYASCVASEVQEGVPLCPEWTFAIAKKLSGNPPESWGLNLRDACKAHTKYGAVEMRDVPAGFLDNPPSFLRDIRNWPDLTYQALKHRKQSYFAVNGPYDSFDNLRASMWKFLDKKCAALFGVIWSWPLSQIIMETSADKGFGHALCQLGWTKDGLYIQNSAGESAGDHGRHYFKREVINHFIEKFGAFMFLDLPRQNAEYMLENGTKIDDNWLKELSRVILNIFSMNLPWKRS